MKVVRLFHTCTNDDNYTGQAVLTPTIMRQIIQIMIGKDYHAFSDGTYHGWIHPFGFFDILNELPSTSSHNPETPESGDVIIRKETIEIVGISGLKMIQTTGTKPLILFARNSDPLLGFDDYYLTEGGIEPAA